jgi:hypothetical protein
MVGADPLDLAALKAEDPAVNAVRSKRRPGHRAGPAGL